MCRTTCRSLTSQPITSALRWERYVGDINSSCWADWGYQSSFIHLLRTSSTCHRQNYYQFCLAITQLVKVLVAPTHVRSFVHAGGPGSIPVVASKLDFGFHPSGIGIMSSNLYVAGWPLQQIAELKACDRKMVSCGYYAARGALPHVIS